MLLETDAHRRVHALLAAAAPAVAAMLLLQHANAPAGGTSFVSTSSSKLSTPAAASAVNAHGSSSDPVSAAKSASAARYGTEAVQGCKHTLAVYIPRHQGIQGLTCVLGAGCKPKDQTTCCPAGFGQSRLPHLMWCPQAGRTPGGPRRLRLQLWVPPYRRHLSLHQQPAGV